MKKNTSWRSIAACMGVLLLTALLAPSFPPNANAEKGGNASARQAIKRMVQESENEARQEIRQDRFMERCEEKDFSEEECQNRGVALAKRVRDLHKERKMDFISNIVDAKKTCTLENEENSTEIRTCMKEKIKNYIKDRILKERNTRKSCRESLGDNPSATEIQECLFGKIYNSDVEYTPLDEEENDDEDISDDDDDDSSNDNGDDDDDDSSDDNGDDDDDDSSDTEENS